MDGLSLNTVRPALPLEPKVESVGISPKGSGASFSDTLKDAIQSVNTLQQDADTKVQNLATGKTQNLHETMIATEKADIALRLMVQVRNKIIDAYQEVMKMQV
jgi:flagellar hook-basal body complex protein FliE